jgi:hypothetical protein
VTVVLVFGAPALGLKSEEFGVWVSWYLRYPWPPLCGLQWLWEVLVPNIKEEV